MTCNERRIIINSLRSEGFDDLVEAGDGIEAPLNKQFSVLNNVNYFKNFSG